MSQRGRKSAAALSVVTEKPVSYLERPEPPADLTAEQAEEWICVTDGLPAEWFSSVTHGLLTQYCRHVVAARKVSQLIAGAEAEKELIIEDYDRLLKMQEREGRALSSLATRMRITQQSTYDKTKKKPFSLPAPHKG